MIMVKTIDDQTLDRAVNSLWNDHTYVIGRSELRMQKAYRVSAGESPQDECLCVFLHKNTPEDYVKNLPSEFEGYKVFYNLEKKPEPL